MIDFIGYFKKLFCCCDDKNGGQKSITIKIAGRCCLKKNIVIYINDSNNIEQKLEKLINIFSEVEIHD